ncbi:MAG: hypothetical protein BalsKO_27820 [Balneolaceae bacterium]
MRLLNIFLITFFFFIPGFTQSFTLNGTVLDEKKAPIYAANIYLKENPSKGVISDFDGNFSFELNNKEMKNILVISYISYLPQEINLSEIDTTKNIVITLRIDQKMLEGIQVFAKDPIAEIFSVKKLSKLDIYKEPVSQGDPLKAITVLPASTNVEESANPSLRGSDGNRSRVFLNSVPIYEPVRFSQINGVGYFSILSPEIINKQYVYASNPPLSLGNSSAGLIQAKTIEELSINQLQLSAGLASIGAFLSQNLGEKSFIQLYGNNQLSGAFLKLNEPNVTDLNRFSTKDGGLNFHSNLSETIKLNLFSYGIIEDFNVATQVFTYSGNAKAETRRNFSILNLKLTQGPNILSLNTSYDIRNEVFDFGNIDSKNQRNSFYTALNYLLNFKGSSIEIGLNHNFNKIVLNDQIPEFYYAPAPNSPITTITETITRKSVEAFVYSTKTFSEKLIFTSGFRTNTLYNNSRNYWSNQVALRYYLTSNHSFLLSGGRYHNFSIPNSFTPNFDLQSSYQVALDYEWTGKNNTSTAAVFFKSEDDETITQTFELRDYLQTFGVEFSRTQVIGERFRFFIANTFLNQKITIDKKVFSGTRTLNYFIKSSITYNNLQFATISLTYVTRPGTRFTEIVNSEFDPQTNFYIPEFSTSFNGKTNGTYNNLSLSMNKVISIKESGLIAFLSINNLLNAKNEEQRLYNKDYSAYRVDNFQLRTLYFGFVWNWNY